MLGTLLWGCRGLWGGVCVVGSFAEGYLRFRGVDAW